MRTSSHSAFVVRDFRFLWLGETISSLGDQFALVALPWLALVLTGSALALGTVLALMAIPRALLMLVGGVYVDRLSPRRVMFVSNAVRLVAVSALGLIVLDGGVQLWMLYAFALVFGVSAAFFFPAQNSIVPALVGEDQLQQANAIVQGTGQLTIFVGPAVAGILIAALGTTGSSPSLTGIAIALFVDGASFAVSLVTLLLIHGGSQSGAKDETVLEAIKKGVAFAWGSSTMRIVVLIVTAINLLVVGPFEVGLPMIAYTRLAEGAAAYGTLMSAMGGGALLGMVAAAMLPSPRPAIMGPAVMSILALTGLGLAALALVDSTPVAFALTALMGLASGYGNLVLITWAQKRIPQALMGRVISLIMLGSMGLIPVSEVVAGAAVQISLSGMLIVAGGTMTLVTLASTLTHAVRNMGLEPTLGEASQSNKGGIEGPAANVVSVETPLS
jgi:MFS family permease